MDVKELQEQYEKESGHKEPMVDNYDLTTIDGQDEYYIDYGIWQSGYNKFLELFVRQIERERIKP